MNHEGFAALVVVGIVALIAIAGAGIWYFTAHRNSGAATGVACTQDAKECPDGSWVGRTGPDCEFAACPAVAANSTPSATSSSTDISGWQTYTNQQYGFEIQYPATWSAVNIENPSLGWIEDPDPPMMAGELLMFFVPSSTIPESTNQSAQVFLGVSTNTVDVANCATGTSEQVGSSTFYRFDYNDGGGAQQYSNVNYEASRNGACYVIQYLFTSGEGLTYQKIVDYRTLVPLLNPILQTYKFLNSTSTSRGAGAFCGGIATGAFPCDPGYSCQLNGTYPDAGGHCVKN